MQQLFHNQRYCFYTCITVLVLLTGTLFLLFYSRSIKDDAAVRIHTRSQIEEKISYREEKTHSQTHEKNCPHETEDKKVMAQQQLKVEKMCENDDDFEQWICNNEHDFDRLSKRLANTKVTGHVFMRDSVTLELTKKPQLKALYDYIQENMKHSSRFCETGFNGGHSSMMWAKLFKGKIELISFDMCNNNGGCDIGQEEIYRLYPNIKHTLVRGDSTVNLPKYTKENPDIKCDFIFIDGGHNGDVPEKDLYNFKPMAKDNHIVVMDDSVWNTTSGYTNWIGKAINKGVQDNLICPITCKPMYLPKMKRLHATCFHKYCK